MLQRKVSSTITRWPRSLAASTSRRVEYSERLRERIAINFLELLGMLGFRGRCSAPLRGLRDLGLTSAILLLARHASTGRGGSIEPKDSPR